MSSDIESAGFQTLEINNEILIHEVKVRPALYNRMAKEYNDLSLKKVLWNEIYAKIYGDVWETMKPDQKRAKAWKVTKRWNNLRSCFSRELKTMRDPLAHKRRKYVYFDKLLFLLNDIHPNFNGGYEVEHSSTVDRLEDENEEMKITHVEEFVNFSENHLEEELALNNSLEDNLEKSGPKIINTDSEINFTLDPDINFALSLVPMLGMITIDKKIDAQIEILSILKKYTKKNTITSDITIVKTERVEDKASNDLVENNVFLPLSK